MKLKYLNPNVIFVASGMSETDAAFSSQEAVLTVQLMDTISGQIVYRQALEVRMEQYEAKYNKEFQ